MKKDLLYWAGSSVASGMIAGFHPVGGGIVPAIVVGAFIALVTLPAVLEN